MNRTIAYFLILSGLSLAGGCIPPSDDIPTDIVLDVNDPVFQQIHDFQDRQLVDSLYPYFKEEDPTFRYLAAMAFASIRNPLANDSLALLLADPVSEVRMAAAYAIGQAGSPSGEALLLEGFEREDTAGIYWEANSAILEAIGKCGSENSLANLSTISTYQPQDTALLVGQTRGIYRFALRGITLPDGTARMLELATNRRYPDAARLIAAHYLQRAEGIVLDSVAGSTLVEAFQSEGNVNIRMALAIALGKSPSELTLQALLAAFPKEKDYRVQCNILRALTNFEYASVQALAVEALRSPNIHVANRAVQFFLEKGSAEDATFYWQTAKDTLPWQVQAGMYEAANRYLPAYYVEYRDAMNGELRRRFRTTDSPYEKAAVLKALAAFGWNYRFIYREGFKSKLPVVRTATLEALAAISNNNNFRSFFGGGYRQVKRELLQYFLEAMKSGDPGMITVAAEALSNPKRSYKDYLDDLSVLDTALTRLEIPKEIEAYNGLNKAIAFLRGQPEPTPMTPAFNHPIDWSMLSRVKDGQHAVIKTERGDIELEFLTTSAPATVANFIALMRQGFFIDRVFHRVVPNFVIQDGCPRGDGYGSLDYTIRSELPRIYYSQQGYIGMASAGNHTECTQFFITHSPTPHLDGNYTIFARVAKGMDIVHQIQMGDRIEEIIIQ